MGNMHVVSIRFHTNGREADLHHKIQEGRKEVGMSAAEYVKQILAGYFQNMEKRSEAEQILQEIRKEYRDMTRRVERIIRQSMQEHGAVLIGALHKMRGMPVAMDMDTSETDTAELPEESGEIPQGASDFLERF